MSTRRILAGLGTLALIGGVALGLAACGTGSGDQVACASFYNTIDNAASASYAKDLAGLNTAAGQAVSQPLASDLQTAAANYANNTGTFVSDGGTVLQDCSNLGHSNPADSATSGTSAAAAPAPTDTQASVADPATQAPAAGSSASSSGTTLTTQTINGQQVLINSAGSTLYWFAPDTSTISKCTGSCATYWPSAPGPATAGFGVTGTLGTITRSDGSTQVTYDGHPLYTYAGDSAPGQNRGNGMNLSGGLWYEATPSGSAPVTGSTATATSGGYGY